MNTFCDEVMDEAGGIDGCEGTLVDPKWGQAGKVHDWRNHVPYFLMRHWQRLTTESRAVAYLCARKSADREDWE